MRRLRLFGCAVVAVTAAAVLSAQQPPRDNVVVRVGTATLSGAVTAEDGRPVRHAVVTVTGASSRAAVTDDIGRFVVSSLQPGSYTVSAARPGFVTMRYGQKRPARGTGITVLLAAGQAVDTGAIRLPRGAVIAGTISDESGRPRRGIQVSIMEYRIVNGERQLVGAASGQGSTPTDDRGMYRAYGLPAGEYVVSAAPPVFEGLNADGDLRRATTAELDWAERQVRSTMTLTGATVTGPRAPVVPEPLPPPGPRVGLAPLYYPGTPDPSMAMTLRVGAGEERTGVDFAVGFVPTAKVDGVITGPDGQPVPANIRVLTNSSNVMRMPSPNVRADSQGTFTIPSLPPGQFTIMAATQTGGLWASAEISVNGQDLTGIALMLQPGSVFSGRLVFEATTLAAPKDFSQARVSLSRAGAPVPGTNFGTRPRPDGTFEILGIIPGAYRLTTAVQGAPGTPDASVWTLKSSVVGGRDVGDAPFEIRPGETLTNAVLTFTDRTAEISGSLVDTAGRPAPDYYVVAFSTDRSDWIQGSRRVRAPVRPASDGRFQLPALPPGAYFVAALTDVDQEDMYDARFLEEVSAGALTITVAEGEKKVQNFRLAAPR